MSSCDAPYMIGTSRVGMVSLGSLGFPHPNVTVPDYVQFDPLANGSTRGMGGRQCEWRFGAFPSNLLTSARSYVGVCYIQTLLESGLYGVYRAILLPIQSRPPKVDYIPDLVLVFKQMVLQ